MNDDLGFADWKLRCHWPCRLIEMREGMGRGGSDDFCESLDAFLLIIIQIHDCTFNGPIRLTLDIGDWMSELDAEIIRDQLLLHSLHRRHGVVIIPRRILLIIGDIHSRESAEVIVRASRHRREERNKIAVKEELRQQESIAIMLNRLRPLRLTRTPNPRRKEPNPNRKPRIAQPQDSRQEQIPDTLIEARIRRRIRREDPMLVRGVDEIRPLVLFTCEDEEETAWLGGDVELGDELEEVCVVFAGEDAHGDVDAGAFGAGGRVGVAVEGAGVALGRVSDGFWG